MKKYIKIILILLVVIPLISIMFPVIPPHSWYSKYVLTNNSILSKLGLDKKQCNYQEAQMLIESHSASISCFTPTRYKNASDEQKVAINNMRYILEKNGWKFSEKESWKFWNVTYNKGFRKIRIYPYDWEQGVDSNFKLIVSLR